MPWLPGLFRPLLHAIPHSQHYTDFDGLIALWAACGAPALRWTGNALPHPHCQDCERLIGPTPTAGLAHHGPRKE
ncbi:MAG: hypothetical protein M3R63_26180 [Actinomycetota bacterium]|nr:hypothetical protein [Actinomycetota bacterium]